MRGLRLNSLRVQNIGPFEDLVLNFPKKKAGGLAEIHIFSGENGTGKSTLLEVMASIDKNLAYINPRVRGNEALMEIELEIRHDNGHVDFEENVSKYLNGTWSIDSYPLTLNTYLSNVNRYPFGKFDFAFFAYSGYRRLVQHQITAIQELTTNPLQNSLRFESSIDPMVLLQWIANTKTKEALSIAKKDVAKARVYRRSIARIEGIVSDITETNVEFVLEDNPLAVTVNSNGVHLPFSTLPDGLKSIISWLADLLMRMDRLDWDDNSEIFDRNFVLFLDEIDVHLHPKWQRRVLPAIQKLFNNAQIFVSTHSPFVVGSVDNAWVYKFEKRDGNSVLPNPPMLSEEANSYRVILEEIFGIDKQFGINVERQLDRFYQIKNEILGGDNIHLEEFTKLAEHLATQSNELENIIGMELKQVKKIRGDQFETLL